MITARLNNSHNKIELVLCCCVNRPPIKYPMANAINEMPITDAHTKNEEPYSGAIIFPANSSMAITVAPSTRAIIK